MKNLLTYTLNIPNHPIRELKEKFRTQYVMGLGEFMYYISRRDKRAKLVFEAWAKSIVTDLPTACWRTTNDYINLRNTITLKRDGLRFFSMRRIFFFDCLYLSSILDAKLVKTAYEFLYKYIRNFITRRVLNNIYTHWNSKKIDKIPIQLLNHRRINEDFQKKPLKKILVVATMNAGKSTLINALIGHRVNAVKTTACTNKLCYTYNKPCDDGITIRYENGELHYRNNKTCITENSNFVETGLHFNSSLAGSNICLIDTPGVNNSENITHGEITRKAINDNNYDAIIYVENCQQFNTDDDANIRNYVLSHTNKPVIFVLNQLDSFNPSDDSISDTIEQIFEITKKNAKSIVVPISAYYALLLRVGKENMDGYDEIQYNHLKKLFQLTYYNLPKYMSCSVKYNNTDEISKTGITTLESLIKKI